MPRISTRRRARRVFLLPGPLRSPSDFECSLCCCSFCVRGMLFIGFLVVCHCCGTCCLLPFLLYLLVHMCNAKSASIPVHGLLFRGNSVGSRHQTQPAGLLSLSVAREACTGTRHFLPGCCPSLLQRKRALRMGSGHRVERSSLPSHPGHGSRHVHCLTRRTYGWDTQETSVRASGTVRPLQHGLLFIDCPKLRNFIPRRRAFFAWRTRGATSFQRISSSTICVLIVLIAEICRVQPCSAIPNGASDTRTSTGTLYGVWHLPFCPFCSWTLPASEVRGAPAPGVTLTPLALDGDDDDGAGPLPQSRA